MKITATLILIGVIHISAITYAQNQRISVLIEDGTFYDVVAQIEKQSDFMFFYKSEEIDNNQRITLKAENKLVADILNEILKQRNLSYKIIDKHIILTKKKSASVNQQVREISGKVTDSNGEPVIGANVSVKGTTVGTITDMDGIYTLSDIPNNSTLVFSYLGMKTQEIPVGNRTSINVTLAETAIGLQEVVAIGYGTVRKSDLTGSVVRIKGDSFTSQSMSQLSEMLAGTVAGINMIQSTSAQGGGSLELRGPKSISAQSAPLIVVDGAIFGGSIKDINTNDIQSIDILKDASSAAVYGSSAASGVILITTKKGTLGKPTISFSGKVGMAEDYKKRRGLGPEEYIEFRKDYLRLISPNLNFDYFTNPNNLPTGMSIEEWRNLSASPLPDNTNEWLARLRFFPEEQANYLAGKTMDMYDEVFQKGLRQDYDISISGGTDNLTYYWSLGYNDYNGIITGDEYSSIRSRLNLDFKVTNWLNIGLNTQFSTRDEGAVPASMYFYVNSPFGDMFDEKGNLKRLPHGHSDNPLLDYYRTDLLDRTNRLINNLYAEVKLPFDIKYKISYQPNLMGRKNYKFVTISEKLGGLSNEIPHGSREDSSSFGYILDNLLSWKKEFGMHNFDVTLLASIEENKFWQSTQSNQNFLPNQFLGYHGLHFGDNPSITNGENKYDTRNTGDALMARLNYILMEKYLLTASVRRDGFSAFGTQNPHAIFPAVALAWIISEENFFKSEFINKLKLRLSWGANGNRNIGMYSALAQLSSDMWYDGSNTRVGVYTSTLANDKLKWERTTSFNIGLDIAILKNRIDLSVDLYDMTTTDLLMKRTLPKVTGFESIMANLGELQNRGFEMTLNTVNMNQPNFSWNSSFVFSLNRNKIKKLFGDYGTYTLEGKEITGEVPDFDNNWFPGKSINAVWDYDLTGIWQTDEAEEAVKYNLRPGDYKAVDVDGDGKYIDLQDKKFIGHKEPRFRLGLRNDFSFLKNFTASVFLRADLGHIGLYSPALNGGYDQSDRFNRYVGPVPYWTADKPNNEYPRIDTYTAAFGGGLKVYKSRSFLRVQDVSLAYTIPLNSISKIHLNNLELFCSIRNLVTFTKWPGWDPESLMNPMPRTYTFGVRFSL